MLIELVAHDLHLLFTGWDICRSNSGHLGGQEYEHTAANQRHQVTGTSSSHQGSEAVI
jgi:hypothetical protein